MSSYANLRRRAVEFVARFSPTGAVLVLAPARAAAEEVALEACGAALVGVQCFGLRDFVLELSAGELNRRGLVPVGRFVREALAARVTAQALQHGTLDYLRPVAGFPGFARALTATFEELRLNSIEPGQLRECSPSGPDLAVLLDAYRSELSERRFADHAARVDLARNAFSASYNSLRQTAVAVLDIAPRSRLEKELLAALMGAAREALDLQLEPGGAEPATSLESLQRKLFSTDAVPVREEDGSVVIQSNSGEALECVEIARAIHAAAAEGVSFDQMAVLLRSPDRYLPLILEALRRGGIPAFCTIAARRPDVAGRSLLALLHCAEEGLSASRFAEYLSLGQMPEEEEEEPAMPALWERLLVDAAVIGGLSRWETRLAGLCEEFHRRHAEEEDEEAREWLARRIAAVENLARLALPVIATAGGIAAHCAVGRMDRGALFVVGVHLA